MTINLDHKLRRSQLSLIQLIASGKRNTEIAKLLGISRDTLRVRITLLNRALGNRSRVLLTRYGVLLGLVPANPNKSPKEWLYQKHLTD